MVSAVAIIVLLDLLRRRRWHAENVPIDHPAIIPLYVGEDVFLAVVGDVVLGEENALYPNCDGTDDRCQTPFFNELGKMEVVV